MTAAVPITVATTLATVMTAVATIATKTQTTGAVWRQRVQSARGAQNQRVGRPTGKQLRLYSTSQGLVKAGERSEVSPGSACRRFDDQGQGDTPLLERWRLCRPFSCSRAQI